MAQENKFLDQKSRRGSLDGQLLLTTVRDVWRMLIIMDSTGFIMVKFHLVKRWAGFVKVTR